MVIHSVDPFPNSMSMLASVMLGDNLEVGQNFCFLLMAEKLIATTILLNVCSPSCISVFRDFHPNHSYCEWVGPNMPHPPRLIRTKITKSNRVKSILWSVALVNH